MSDLKSNLKNSLLILVIICILITGLGIYLIRGIDPVQLQVWLKQMGIWAPILYIALYTIGTLCILPSTPLNLAGGAIFGTGLGTLWTSIGALIAAILAFLFTRTIGREVVAKRLAGRWQTIDTELCNGGLFYMFAIRLQPIIPYGLVNFASGLTSVTFKDYVLGTALGTVPGVLPFVMIGSSGVTALKGGDVFPLVIALTLAGVLVAGAAWQRRRIKSRRTVQMLQQLSQIHEDEL